MKHIIGRHTLSLKNAFEGLKWAWTTQPNYRVHLIISLCVIIAGFFFNISGDEWIAIVMTIAIGLVIETINTSIEATADAITREWHQDIKIAKDAAAAAMLTYAIGSIIVAAIIFIPHML